MYQFYAITNLWLKFLTIKSNGKFDLQILWLTFFVKNLDEPCRSTPGLDLFKSINKLNQVINIKNQNSMFNNFSVLHHSAYRCVLARSCPVTI